MVNTHHDSADGRRNAYYHTCRVTEQQRAYAACLARVNGLKGDPECDNAIGKKFCPAIAMRQEEVDQGKPIYFVEREQVAEFISTVKSWTAPTPVQDRVKAEKKTSVMDELAKLDTNIGTAAVNRAAQSQSSVKKMTVKQGESPLEAFKRIKGNR